MSAKNADALAEQAGRQHRGRRAAEAERLYREALAQVPGHAASLHGLGCLAHEAGRPDLAIGLIGQAVAAEPSVAHYTISLGLALLDRGHVEEARAALHVAALRDPEDPRAHRALAQALSRLGRLDEAEASLRTALRLDPASTPSLMSLGSVLRARGEDRLAVAAFAKAARLAPKDPLAWHALASSCGTVGDLTQAEAAFRQVAMLLPADAAALANLGTALFALDRLDDARRWLLQAQARAPENPATLSSLGLVLMGLGESVEAERVLASAARLAPESDAIAINYGTALAALARHAEAETIFRTVLTRDPADDQARFNLATMLLGRGALAEGWAAFEARLGLGRRASPPQRQWDGGEAAQPDAGEAAQGDGGEAGPVLIRAEQGLGDTIQFLRWIGPAAVRARLVLDLPPTLRGLVERAPWFDPTRMRLLAPRAEADPAGEVTAQASLLSLPHLLRQPSPPAIRLRAEPAAVQSWETRLSARSPSGLRVGLTWAGSAAYRFDRQRSMRLEQMAPLATIPGLSFVSLQQGAAAAQALTPPGGMALFTPELPAEDLAETAALIASLDLVICVDTMIAHLAASLGVPVWLLDRFGGDWRWREGFAFGRDWYPGLRRFAQAAPGAWGPVMEEVAGALAALAQNASR